MNDKETALQIIDAIICYFEIKTEEIMDKLEIEVDVKHKEDEA